MAFPNQQQNQSQPESAQRLAREIPFGEGFELAFYTLRRLNDGHLQSYMLPANSNDHYVQAMPIATQLSGMELFEMSQAGRQGHQLPPLSSNDNGPYHKQAQAQQTYNIPIRGLHQPDIGHREPSVITLLRRAHARDDGYTTVCGVFSPETSIPVKLYNPGEGNFCCPRCESNYTRPKSVKDHFFYCVSKYGNPQALRFTDHPSMVHTEETIQYRMRWGRNPSTRTKKHNAQSDVHHPETEVRDMREALARTSLRVIQENEMSHDKTKTKTEYVLEADIPRESIETPSPERHLWPTPLHEDNHSVQSTSSRSQPDTAQTPDWQVPPRTNHDFNSSTPTPHNNPWNIGIPGSSTENETMNMRATAPFEGWSHASQTPEPTNCDGTSNDGLDDFMDRRSYFSATPVAPHHQETISVVYEECEMGE